MYKARLIFARHSMEGIQFPSKNHQLVSGFVTSIESSCHEDYIFFSWFRCGIPLFTQKKKKKKRKGRKIERKRDKKRRDRERERETEKLEKSFDSRYINIDVESPPIKKYFHCSFFLVFFNNLLRVCRREPEEKRERERERDKGKREGAISAFFSLPSREGATCKDMWNFNNPSLRIIINLVNSIINLRYSSFTFLFLMECGYLCENRTRIKNWII